MCGRYTLSSVGEIKTRFDTGNSIKYDASWNIAPGTLNPVIVKEDARMIVKMKWGLIPFWAKDPKIGYKMANARAEGIENKPAFRLPIRKRRCLVPSDGFYEWKSLILEGKSEKHPWFIGLRDRRLFAFAGIYDVWKDAEGKQILSYSVITTEPNNVVNEIHTRMSVILKPEDEEVWLRSDTDLKEILNKLKPYPGEDMTSHPVSLSVNNPENDTKELINPE